MWRQSSLLSDGAVRVMKTKTYVFAARCCVGEEKFPRFTTLGISRRDSKDDGGIKV